jgi:hypothetical protein
MRNPSLLFKGQLIFVLYVGFAFLESPKTATGGGCFLWLQRFSAPVGLWEVPFSAQIQHGSMLGQSGCVCGGM